MFIIDLAIIIILLAALFVNIVIVWKSEKGLDSGFKLLAGAIFFLLLQKILILISTTVAETLLAYLDLIFVVFVLASLVQLNVAFNRVKNKKR